MFARINTEQFQHSFLLWVQAIQQVRSDLIAIDGKTHRRPHDRANGKAALHLVSAWAAENRLVLGQVAVDDKSNEILRQEPSKGSLKTKRFRAALNDDYESKVLGL